METISIVAVFVQIDVWRLLIKPKIEIAVMDCSDSTLNLPIPKPLSLKRKRLFNDEYQETGRDPFCNEFGSNESERRLLTDMLW